MDKRAQFNEALTSLVEFATVHGNQVTIEDVQTFLGDLIEDDSQYQFVYDYLNINKISVDGVLKEISKENLSPSSEGIKETTLSSKINVESEEELSFINMYMEELSDIIPATPDEVSHMLQKLNDGDMSIVNRLVECNLQKVAAIAKDFSGKGVTLGDLIQEGNISLMLAISSYNPDIGDFDNYIEASIREGISSIINTQNNSDRVGQHLADELNQLDNVTTKLSQELGRVPELSELAKAMGMDEEKVSVLLKTSLDTLSLNQEDIPETPVANS